MKNGKNAIYLNQTDIARMKVIRESITDDIDSLDLTSTSVLVRHCIKVAYNKTLQEKEGK